MPYSVSPRLRDHRVGPKPTMYWVTFTPNFLAGTMCPTSCSAIEASRPTAKIRTPRRYSTSRPPFGASSGAPGQLASPAPGPRLCLFYVLDGTWVPGRAMAFAQPLVQYVGHGVHDLKEP